MWKLQGNVGIEMNQALKLRVKGEIEYEFGLDRERDHASF